MCRMPYDFPGDPELAHNIAKFADKHGTWITAIDDEYLPIYYATINLWKFLGEGLPDKRWVTIGVCQTGDMEDHLRARPRPGRRHRRHPGPPGPADRLRRPVAHLLAAARAARPRGQRPGAHLHARGARGRLRAHRLVQGGPPRQGPRHHAGVLEVQARGEVLPLPDDGRRPRRAGVRRQGPPVRRVRELRSAPARSTSGSTARPTAGPAPACPPPRPRTPHSRI